MQLAAHGLPHFTFDVSNVEHLLFAFAKKPGTSEAC